MEESEEITIEYPLDKLDKGEGSGYHVHRNWDGGWCMRYGSNDNPRTRCHDNFGVKPEDRQKTTHLQITEDEIEKHIVMARREAKDAEARLRNLEKLNFELCMRRKIRGEREHFSDDEQYLTVSSAD